jgi:hypothetical protein
LNAAGENSCGGTKKEFLENKQDEYCTKRVQVAGLGLEPTT